MCLYCFRGGALQVAYDYKHLVVHIFIKLLWLLRDTVLLMLDRDQGIIFNIKLAYSQLKEIFSYHSSHEQ